MSHNNIVVMTRGYALQLILALALLTLAASETNGTEAYFLSPHGLGRTPEVDNALEKMTGQIKVKRTTYNHSAITYILDNVTIGTAYNDGKQTTEIPRNELTKITGGRIEFTYRFNYTKIENKNNVTGYGYGSVLSDPLTYYKELSFCGGFLCWKVPVSPSVENLTLIENRMKIRRLEPFNQSDLENLEDMLDKAFTSIDPANFEVQILEIFNQVFPLALNDSLNHEVFGEKINYSFYSNTHGEMKMNIIHKLYSFGVKPEKGYHVVFVTEIENWPEPICNQTIANEPYDFVLYGGSQNFHLHCLYQSVVSYVHSNGWLDVVLDDSWETDNFQFYAGDLFDLIGNLNNNFSPRALLDGKCTAQKEGLNFKSAREFSENSYMLEVAYNCSVKGTNKDATTAEVMRFKASTRIYIKVEVTTRTLNFRILYADILNLSFQPVGAYVVNNMNLAMFKANSVIKKVSNTYTFGSGFPTIVRELPKAKVEKDSVLYYDSGHFAAPTPLDS